MGLFGKIKDKLGVGGVRAELQQIPDSLARDGGSIQGNLVLTTKSDQEISTIKVIVQERLHKQDKSINEYTVASVNLEGNFQIQEGETKEMSFTLDYPTLMTVGDVLKAQDNMYKPLERSTWRVEAQVDVKAAAIDPSDKVDVSIAY